MDRNRVPLKLFCSYSHKDEKLRAKLETHLSGLKAEGVIEDWYDRKIPTGGEWEREIDTNLESADIILFLVSADFQASNYCRGVEVKRAMERHEAREARVIPVILRECDWQSEPFAKLQGLPTDGKSVTSWRNRDTAFKIVAKAIRSVAVELQASNRESEGSVGARVSEKEQTAPKRSLGELIFLVEWTVGAMQTILQQPGPLEKRRILQIVKEMRSRIAAPISALIRDLRRADNLEILPGFPKSDSFTYITMSSPAADVASAFEQLWFQELDEFLFEADLLIPRVGDQREMGDTSILRRLKSRIEGQWKRLQGRLLLDEGTKEEYDTVALSSERAWPLIGFKNRETYLEYVEPRLEALLNSARTFEPRLLQYLADEGRSSIGDLRGMGFPEGLIVDVVNCLGREHCLDLDALHKRGEVLLTNVGRSVLLQALSISKRNPGARQPGDQPTLEQVHQAAAEQRQ